MSVKLHVDLETLQLIQGPGQRSAVTTLRFKRGDSARLQVTFLESGVTPTTIGDPGNLEIQIGIKPRNQFDRSYLAHSADWSMPSEGDDAPAYGCTINFNTLQLESALNIGSATAEELSEITLMGEITWREGSGEPTSTRTFIVVVENDVNRGTEGVPTSAEPPYPTPQSLVTVNNIGNMAVRHDVAQSLSTTAKSRARTNIGAVSATDVEAVVNNRPKIVAQPPESTTETLPASYPILFHSGSDAWLLPAGYTAEAAILLTGAPTPGQIVMEWQVAAGSVSSYPTSTTLPAGNYAFELSIVDLVPIEDNPSSSALFLNLSGWNNSIYSNVIYGSAMGQFSFFSMPLQLYASFNSVTPGGQTGSADLYIEGESTVDINFVEGDPCAYRLILTFTPI